MLTTCQLAGSGKYKLYSSFQAAGHISDWRGCNYRLLTVPGQPKRGFDTLEELKMWAVKKYPTYLDASRAAHSGLGDGMFHNQETHRILISEREEEWWAKGGSK